MAQLSSAKCRNPACWRLCFNSSSLKLKSNPPSSVADAPEHVFCMTSFLPYFPFSGQEQPALNIHALKKATRRNNSKLRFFPRGLSQGRNLSAALQITLSSRTGGKQTLHCVISCHHKLLCFPDQEKTTLTLSWGIHWTELFVCVSNLITWCSKSSIFTCGNRNILKLSFVWELTMLFWPKNTVKKCIMTPQI